MIDWALVKDSLLVSQNVQIKQYATEITASLFFTCTSIMHGKVPQLFFLSKEFLIYFHHSIIMPQLLN